MFLLLTPLQALELNELLSLLGKQKSGQVAFAELKKIQLLDAPIEVRGTLILSDKGVLIKDSDSPVKERLEIDAHEMRIIKNGKTTQALRLSERPEAEAIVAGLRAVILGDQKILQLHYHTKLTGKGEKWTLLLTPKSEAAKRVLKHIQFSGRQGLITQIDTTMSNGDQTLTTLIQ